MYPSELHREHQTLSCSSAALTPSIDMIELADLTLPPAVVVASSVM
jgi:hypothetical protein